MEYFYSNCLLAALKAKLKDLKHIHIHKIPGKWNHEIFPHFWWDDGINAFDFISKKERHLQIILFKGGIRKRRLEVYKDNVIILKDLFEKGESII